MTNQVTKRKPMALDNFADFDESVEGDDDKRFGSALVGTRLKFTNDATWVSVNGEDFSDRVLLATNVRRLETKWIDGLPSPESRELQAGDKFRDLDALNETCPRSEWRDCWGTMKGPWERQYVIEFADIKTMEQYSWPTSTTGGCWAASELVDRINKKRRLEGRNDLWAYVKLSHCYMKTKWKGRERPDCKIVDWYSPPKSEAVIEPAPAQPLLPFSAPDQAVQPPPASSASEAKSEPKYELSSGAFEPVTEPVSLAEEMKDEVKF
jgi:hypothetical protein